MKYSKLKILFSIYTERKHRIVFDNLYIQSHKIKNKNKPLLIYYKILCFIIPDFRQYIKHYKDVLNRGYNQKRLNLFNYIIFFKLRKINTERYSFIW